MIKEERWYYATYNPYSVHTLNKNGNCPNILYRWSPRSLRDRFVDDDPTHCEAIPANYPLVRRLKAQGQEYGWPVDYFDK